MPKPRTIFRGWKVVGAGFSIQALQSALVNHAMGQYLVTLEAEFGWSKSSLSAAYSLNRAESALLGPLQGWLLDRFGPKRVAEVGACIMTVGMLAFSQTRSLLQFFLSFVVVSIGAGLSGFLTVTVAIVRWFERRRARALAVGSMGFALGGAAIPGVVYLFDAIGWRWTAAGSGLVAGAAIFVLARVLAGSPADVGEIPDGHRARATMPSTAAEGLATVHFTAGEAVRTRAFWMISLGHMSALFTVGAVMAHLALYLTSERGYSHLEASIVSGVLPLVQLVGMGLGGWLGDRVNKRLIASAAMLGHAMGMTVLAFGGSLVTVVVFVALHGLAWGARGPLMQALRADYFGSTSFGSIMGLSSLIVMLGTTLGPLVAGILADVTGSYRVGFVILAGIAAVGMIFFVLATPPAPPGTRRKAAGQNGLGLGGQEDGEG